jgi:hypothetical protein
VSVRNAARRSAPGHASPGPVAPPPTPGTHTATPLAALGLGGCA